MLLDLSAAGRDLAPPRWSGRRRRRSFGCLKFFGCLFLLILLMAGMFYGAVYFLVGPLVVRADQLPEDFPLDFNFYQLEKAAIKIQTSESKEKILRIITSTPNWLLVPFLNYLSTDLKTQLVQTFGDDLKLRQFTVRDLKSAIETMDPAATETVSLSWQSIDRTKEELAFAYKQQLALADFEVRENLEDYRIILGFWRENIFGAMSFEDSFRQTGASKVDITVNYLKP